jgi:hypothetical protein
MIHLNLSILFVSSSLHRGTYDAHTHVRYLLFLLLFLFRRLVTKERQKDIVTNLDCVNVEKTLAWRNKGKIDGMGRNPDRPTSHDSRLEVGLELVFVLFKGLALHQTEVTKEHETKDGVPDGLINGDLGGNRQGSGSRKLPVEETVKVVTGRSVNQESETSQSDGTHDIVRLVCILDKVLCETITGGETDQGCQGLGEERLRRQKLIVSSPESTHFGLLNNSDGSEANGENCVSVSCYTNNENISMEDV